ncbi:MAG: diguanylate cyclase domain-containing protein [Burkholderiales bacterium]
MLNNTLSAGVAAWPADAGTPVDLLRAADAALYRAKTGGRNRVFSALSRESAC